jgi:hypothetical protein
LIENFSYTKLSGRPYKNFNFHGIFLKNALLVACGDGKEDPPKVFLKWGQVSYPDHDLLL